MPPLVRYRTWPLVFAMKPKLGQILISPRVFTAVKEAVTVEPVGEFTLKGIGRPLAAYNVLAASPQGRDGLFTS
jgi:class 3 adenylate cyclase